MSLQIKYKQYVSWAWMKITFLLFSHRGLNWKKINLYVHYVSSIFIFCHTFHDGMFLLLFTLHSAIYYYYFVGMCFMHGNLIEIYLVAAEMSQSTIFFMHCRVSWRRDFRFNPEIIRSIKKMLLDTLWIK